MLRYRSARPPLPLPLPLPLLLTARPSPLPLPLLRLHLHSSSNSSSTSSSSTSTSTSTTKSTTAHSPDDLQAARAWLAALHPETLPLRAIGELSFSRSSGPGGQNVNKVNSKATLRVPLDALLQRVPPPLHRDIARSRYLAARSNALIVHADESRKQSDNALTCYRRIYEAIAQAARAAIPAEASPDQVQRVKNLQHADNERRLHSKKHQSAKKSSRRARGDD